MYGMYGMTRNPKVSGVDGMYGVAYLFGMSTKSDRFEMRVPPDLIEKVDEWRAQQPGIPSRASAIRHMIETYLHEDEKAPTRKPRRS